MTMTDDIFHDCETMDELFALVLAHDGGPEVLQALLANMAPNAISREILEQAAENMAAAGLPQAAMVQEAAEEMNNTVSTEVVAILKDHNRANIRARLASLYRRQKLTPVDWEYIAEHCGQDTLDFITGKRFRR
jgi:hypothetical protein